MKGVPHTCYYSSRQVPKRSVWLHPSLLELVDSFGDASTALRLDALQFNTSRMEKRISIKLPGVI